MKTMSHNSSWASRTEGHTHTQTHLEQMVVLTTPIYYFVSNTNKLEATRTHIHSHLEQRVRTNMILKQPAAVGGPAGAQEDLPLLLQQDVQGDPRGHISLSLNIYIYIYMHIRRDEPERSFGQLASRKRTSPRSGKHAFTRVPRHETHFLLDFGLVGLRKSWVFFSSPLLLLACTSFSIFLSGEAPAPPQSR